MKHTNEAATEESARGAHANVGHRALQPWVRPRLVRVGSVAQVTAKVDMMGRRDGVTGSPKRT